VSFNVAMLKQMRAEGLSFEAAIRVLEAGEEKRSSGAERQARYRERKRNESDVTRDVTPSPNEIDILTPTREEKPEAKASVKKSVQEENRQAIGSCLKRAFPPPLGVSEEQWAAFRKQRRKSINERSYTLLSKKLAKLAEAGWPPGEMIDLAIERGWETVFEPRNERHDRRTDTLGRNQSDGLSSTARAAIAVFGSPNTSQHR
jgi:hypothetical protein